MIPLWGGGFLVAFSQLALFYYVLGTVLHFVVPLLCHVKGIQEQQRRPGEVKRDAINSLGLFHEAAASDVTIAVFTLCRYSLDINLLAIQLYCLPQYQEGALVAMQ
jgi:hypothetical protein